MRLSNTSREDVLGSKLCEKARRVLHPSGKLVVSLACVATPSFYLSASGFLKRSALLRGLSTRSPSRRLFARPIYHVRRILYYALLAVSSLFYSAIVDPLRQITRRFGSTTLGQEPGDRLVSDVSPVRTQGKAFFHIYTDEEITCDTTEAGFDTVAHISRKNQRDGSRKGVSRTLSRYLFADHVAALEPQLGDLPLP